MTIATIIIVSLRIGWSSAGYQTAQAATENLNLIKEIERFETRQHVSLQAQPKRNHRHDHRDADNHAHRRQCSAQSRLPQIAQGQFKYVEKAHWLTKWGKGNG